MNQALQRLAEIWHSWTTSRYTKFLEWEVQRLQEENRGLLNSLLTRAGVQPIDTPKPVARQGTHKSRYQRQIEIEQEWIAAQKKQ